MAEIKTDVLSTVSSSGSGLQLKSLTSSLVEAATSGERTLTERKIEDTNTTISAMGQLSQKVGLFKSSMASIAEAASRTATSSSVDVSIEVTEESIATDVSAVVEVLGLASGQILSFRFDASVTPSTGINQGLVSLNTVAGDNPASFYLDSNNATLTGLTEELNKIQGISASLLDTGTGYALIIKSEDGTGNALNPASIDEIKSALKMDNNAPDGVVTAINPLGVASTETEARNASLLVDGVAVQRSSNEFEDLFTGHKITLNAVGTSTLRSSDTSASVKDRLSNFLATVNELKSYLSEATQRGINGAKPGPLAGDIAAQSIQNRIRNIATQPITGFGGDPLYLAQIGVQTERDGTLTLNAERFERALEENPELANALFTTKYSSPNADLSIRGLSFAPPKPGTYDLVYDKSTDPETATLDGQSLTISTNSNGNVVLRSNDGDTRGVMITLGTNETLTTTVSYGQSLADQLQDYGDTLLGTSGLLARRETDLDKDLLEFETKIEDLDSKVEQLTARYNTQFGRMEAVISSLKRTGEYMQSMMDSWIASK
jgi:flagellar hook-associated protein 2